MCAGENRREQEKKNEEKKDRKKIDMIYNGEIK